MSVVLIVSDDEVTATRTTAMLEGMCFEVVVATTESEVTRLCLASRPSIVISDVETGGNVGFDSIATVRRLVNDAYIVAMSRSKHQDMWLRVAGACGADDYVPGPLTMLSLVDAIDACNDVTRSVSCLPDSTKLN
jgi:DNA-binding response OmpR family regulator